MKQDPEVANVTSYPLHRVVAVGAKIAF